jgi:broad specificity phosphatase PhoE
VIRLTLVATARPRGSRVPSFPDATQIDAPRAWNAGDWAGLPIDEVAHDHPQDFRRWRTDPSFAPPGGESLEALLARVGQWLDSLTDERLAVVVDPTVVAAAIVHALAATPESFWHLDVRPSSESRLSRTAGTWRVRSLGIDLASPH